MHFNHAGTYSLYYLRFRGFHKHIHKMGFAFSHGYQGWAGIVDTGIYGGLVLSLLYWWRGGRLAAPVFAHIGWNLIAALGIYFLY